MLNKPLIRRPAALVVLLVALGLCGAVRAQGAGALRVTSAQLPSTLEPGQRAVANVSVRALEAGEQELRPLFWLISRSEPSQVFQVNSRQLAPWVWPAPARDEQRHVAVTLDVPADFAPGAAQLLFKVGARSGDGWIYAALQDQQGNALGEGFSIDVMIASGPSAADAEPVELPLLIPKMAPPKIDGQVRPEEWRSASAIERFAANLPGREISAQTKAFIGHDGEKLYVAFVCDEPLMQKALARRMDGRDGAIWDNECVEVLLSPGGDRGGYIHLIVDMLNQRYDALGSDHWGFNPPWDSAVQRGEQQWSVELAISFAALGVDPPSPGQVWHVGLFRERKAVDEHSAWKPTHGAFAQPGKFGTWVFDSLSAQLLAADLEGPREGWPEPLRGDAGKWEQQVKQWRQRVEREPAAMSAARYRELAGELQQLQRRRDKLRLAVARHTGQRYVIARAWPYQPFQGEAHADEAPLGPIELTLLHNEWVDLAFNVTNLGDEPLILRAMTHHADSSEAAGAFVHPGIGGLTTLWQQATPVAAADGRLVYDAIVPSPAGLIHIPPGQTAQAWLSIRADAGTAGELSGGIEIKPIDAGAGEPLRLPLAVNVVPVDLTRNPPIHCMAWNFAGPAIEDQPHWWRQHLLDLREHGVDIFMISSLNHLPRVQAEADGTMPQTLDFSRLDHLLEHSRGLFRLYWINLDIFEKHKFRTDLIGLEFGTPEYERAFKSWLSQLLAHLHERGLGSDDFIINPYDESVDERCRLLARWVKEVDPSVRIVIDSSTPELEVAQAMDAVTDIWMPHYSQFFPAEMQPFHELLRSTGKPIWTYYYSEGSNDKHQHPSRHYLSKFWWAWANNVTGMGYWAQQYYGDPWHRAAHRDAYDTALWYPTEQGVLPSRRWQAWRQGWQDYLLLSLVSAAVGDDVEARATLEAKVQDVVKFPGDSQRAEASRRWLKQALAERQRQ